MYHYIYKTTNTLNGHYYIGCRSCKVYPLKDKSYYGSGNYIFNAKRKYKKDFKKIFHKAVWFLCPNKGAKFNCESWIVNEELLKDPLCMNLYPGGDGGSEKGLKHSDETKKKISKSCKGKNLGKFHTLEARKKMSIAKQNMSDETKKKMSEARKNTPWNKGIKHSDETKKKMSKARKGKDNGMFGKTHSIESRKKMSIAKQNMSDETKRKISEYAKNRTEEHKKKLGLAQKGHTRQCGKNHSHFGMLWITDGHNSKLIKTDSPIPNGWRKGRICAKKLLFLRE
jgi:hypothetical protein